MHPAEDPQASRASLLMVWSSNGGIIVYGSRRVIVSQQCSGPNLLVEPARHRLQSQKTVRDERQLWLCLIRTNHLSSDWWRGVWESSLSKFYLSCWLPKKVRNDPFWFETTLEVPNFEDFDFYNVTPVTTSISELFFGDFSWQMNVFLNQRAGVH